MIPTAKAFYQNYIEENNNDSHVDIEEMLIEFAKLHVEAALKEALESIPCLGSSSDIATYEEVEDAVLNAYPLTLIK
jgi:hypothetical protein